VTASPEAHVLAFDGFRIDARQRLLFDRDGKPAPLPARAFDMLLFMAEHPDELLDKQRLMKAVWPHAIVEENNLSQNISLLRRVLGEAPNEHRFIVTVPGRGFRFVPPVQRLDAVPTSLTPPTATGRRRPPAVVPAIVAMLAAVAIGAPYYLMRPAPVHADSTPLGRVSRITPLTTFPGDETSPSFAPDGTRVAFAWARDGGDSDIYVMQTGLGDPLRLTHGGGVNRDPAWSPDGQQIAFLRQHGIEQLDLMLVPALGGAERKLQAVRMNFVSHEGSPRLAWTSDSQQLIFTTQREATAAVPAFELRAISLDTGRVQPLNIAQQDPDFDTSPALTRDSTRLAFVRFRKGQRLGSLMVQDLDPGLVPRGPPRRVPGVKPGNTHSPIWSRDGRLLRFVVGTDILEWDTRAGVRTVHTIPATPFRVGSMAIAANDSGARAAIALVDSDENIWAVPLDPVRHVAAGPPVARAVSTSLEVHPRLSPDGRYLAFISGRSGRPALWVADADGTNPRQLSNLDELVVGFPRWSPDGKRIAFHTSSPDQERLVYIVELASGIPRKLARGCCPSSWSADGRYIYVGDLTEVNSVARLSVTKGKRERLFKGGFGAETLDGRKLLYAKDEEPGLFARSMQGDVTRNPEEKLVDDYRYTPGGYLPVEGGIYYVGYMPDGRPRAFRYYDYASGAVHDVMRAPRRVSFGLTVSPDERELLYSADKEDAGADITLFEFAEH
jgi:Tol biopolymer transport system component/DNA-binding winged helix-turn-helix (wHTH) protein